MKTNWSLNIISGVNITDVVAISSPYTFIYSECNVDLATGMCDFLDFLNAIQNNTGENKHASPIIGEFCYLLKIATL